MQIGKKLITKEHWSHYLNAYCMLWYCRSELQVNLRMEDAWISGGAAGRPQNLITVSRNFTQICQLCCFLVATIKATSLSAVLCIIKCKTCSLFTTMQTDLLYYVPHRQVFYKHCALLMFPQKAWLRTIAQVMIQISHLKFCALAKSAFAKSSASSTYSFVLRGLPLSFS